jgi:predicted PurR-regulated permease PerM
VFYVIRAVLWPFVVSWILAYLLNPLVSHFENQGYKRSFIVLLFYVFSIGFLVVAAFIIMPLLMDELARLKNHLPVYIAQLKISLLDITDKLNKYYPSSGGEDFSQMLVHRIQMILQGAVSNIPVYLVNVFSLFALFILIPFITFSFLLEWKKISSSIFNLLPAKYVETVLSIICEIDEVLGGFVRGQIVRIIIMSFLAVAGLWYLHMDYAILMGFFLGLTNAIPYVGHVIGSLPIILVAFFKYGLVMVWKVIALIVIIQLLDTAVISPVTMTKSVNLHFILVIFAILAGAELFGFMGVILGVPLFCIIKIIVKILYTNAQQIELANIPELNTKRIILEQFKA